MASRILDNRMFAKRAFYCRLESHLRSPEENLEEAPPIPGIRYVMDGSLDIRNPEVYFLIVKQATIPPWYNNLPMPPCKAVTSDAESGVCALQNPSTPWR